MLGNHYYYYFPLNRNFYGARSGLWTWTGPGPTPRSGSVEGQGQGQTHCGPDLEGQGQVRQNWSRTWPGPDRGQSNLRSILVYTRLYYLYSSVQPLVKERPPLLIYL